MTPVLRCRQTFLHKNGNSMNLGNGKKVQLILFGAVLAATGCGGGGSGGGDGSDNGPTVTTQSCTENCGDIATGEEPKVLDLDSPLSTSIAQGETRVFKIPSGAEVSVIADSGDVELVLFDELADIDLNDLYGDQDLCRSAVWRVREDNCTANTSDNDMYAVIQAYYNDSSFTITATTDCSVENINRWIYRNMQDYYLYADSVPSVNTDTYTDPSDLVNDLRQEELDPFSFITDSVTQTQLYNEGISFGFGYDWQRDTEDQIRLTYVYDDSPFGSAGFKRGDIAVSLQGELLDDMPSERFRELLGDTDNPNLVEWVFIDHNTRQTKTATLSMREYRINTVLHSDVFTRDSLEGRVGYLSFRRFLETSRTELDNAIALINAQNPTDLVLDLRYNSGGRSDVGRRLSSQIGGPDLAGQIHSRNLHSARYSELDSVDLFVEALPSLNLNRLIVLTTDRTASASERLINSLKPFMEVVTIGSKTTGKSFRSRSKNFCGKALNAMASEGVNANNVSIDSGISADCFAADDPTKDFGTRSGSTEGMLDTALNYAFSGSCLTPSFTKFSDAGANKNKSVLKTYEQLLYGDDF